MARTSWNRRNLGASLFGAVVMAAGAACTDSPTAPTLLSTSTKYQYSCGGWLPAVPPDVRALFDLQVPGMGAEAAPPEEKVAKVEAAGGRIVYRFHGDRVRAEIDASSIESLADQDVVETAWSVTDPRNFRVVVAVGIDHPTPDDLAAAEALGATVLYVLSAVGIGYVVEIDDRLVPALRNLPRVKYTEFDGVGCLR